jgi:hypothetical protein
MERKWIAAGYRQEFRDASICPHLIPEPYISGERFGEHIGDVFRPFVRSQSSGSVLRISSKRSWRQAGGTSWSKASARDAQTTLGRLGAVSVWRFHFSGSRQLALLVRIRRLPPELLRDTLKIRRCPANRLCVDERSRSACAQNAPRSCLMRRPRSYLRQCVRVLHCEFKGECWLF